MKESFIEYSIAEWDKDDGRALKDSFHNRIRRLLKGRVISIEEIAHLLEFDCLVCLKKELDLVEESHFIMSREAKGTTFYRNRFER